VGLEGAIGGELVELASGVDALYMSGQGDVSLSLLEDLATARAAAEVTDEPVLLGLGDLSFVVKPRSLGRYRYWLQHEFGQIGVSDKTDLPPLRMQPKAEYLHAVGPAAAVSTFRDVAHSFTRELRLSASRVDVFADLQGWNLHADDRHCFVTRATRRNTHEQSEQLTGFEFGRRTSKTVMARLYDKTLDVKQKGADWWPAVWGSAYDVSRPVLRVEFEFGRIGLKQFGVDTAADALAHAPSLWQQATGEWLSHRTPTSDSTRSRWPLSAEWQQVQGVSFAQEATGLERIREGRNRGSLRKLMPGLVGYLTSAGAHLGATDLETALALLPGPVRDYGLASRTTFEDRLRDKRRALGAA
jgi:hypothetical protein